MPSLTVPLSRSRRILSKNVSGKLLLSWIFITPNLLSSILPILPRIPTEF